MAVTYDYYRIFYYVAKYHSFTRAAKILMNSQPNITRAMNNLEQELGCRLFLRSNRGVALTPEGEKLFTHVRIAQEQLQAGEAELTSKKALESGYVSVGASEIALHELLLPVLRKFRRSYPGVHIQITNHSTPQAVTAVKNGLVDLAVVTTPSGVERPLKELPLKKFRDILVAGPYLKELSQKTLHLEELSSYPLISLGRDTKSYEFYDRIFAEHNCVLQPYVEAATTDQILPMVKHDLGLGFVPQSFAKEAIAKGEVFEVRLAEPIPDRYICLVRDKSRPFSAAAQKLEEMIRAAGAMNADGDSRRL